VVHVPAVNRSADELLLAFYLPKVRDEPIDDFANDPLLDVSLLPLITVLPPITVRVVFSEYALSVAE
jgi:hypothetical protein